MNHININISINNSLFVSLLINKRYHRGGKQRFFPETFKADMMRQDATDSQKHPGIVEI